MSEQAQSRRGNRQQPVPQEGEAPAPAPPSDVAALIAEMRAEFQAQLARLEERHQESNARLLTRIQENEAQRFLREQAQGAQGAPPPPPPPAGALQHGRPDVRVPEFPVLDEDPEKATTLPGITLRTSLHFQACDQKLLSFEEFPSFNPVAQETPPDQRLAKLLIASLNLKLRLLWTRHVAPLIPEQMSYNAIKHTLMTYVAKEEFRDNAAAFFRNYQQAICVTPADLRVAWHYLPMAFGPQLTSYDVRKAAYECFLPDSTHWLYTSGPILPSFCIVAIET